MYATIIITIIVAVYSAFMIRKSYRLIKKSLRGEGCDSCSSECDTCNVVTDFNMK